MNSEDFLATLVFGMFYHACSDNLKRIRRYGVGGEFMRRNDTLIRFDDYNALAVGDGFSDTRLVMTESVHQVFYAFCLSLHHIMCILALFAWHTILSRRTYWFPPSYLRNKG